LNGHYIACFGYNNKLNRLFDSLNVYEEIVSTMSKSSTHTLFTISPLKDIHYTATFIFPQNNESDIFILSPFSYNDSQPYGIVYKPKFILPHIVTTLNSIWRDCPKTSLDYPRCQPYNLHVNRAIDYMYHRYQDEITLSDMAKHLNISKHYFSSMFKRETGKTFIQFLNEIRIEKSKEMLLDGNSSMLDIALSVGFNTQNYFNITFKKHTGSTPMEYKNSMVQ